MWTKCVPHWPASLVLNKPPGLTCGWPCDITHSGLWEAGLSHECEDMGNKWERQTEQPLCKAGYTHNTTQQLVRAMCGLLQHTIRRQTTGWAQLSESNWPLSSFAFIQALAHHSDPVSLLVSPPTYVERVSQEKHLQGLVSEITLG